MRLVFFGLAALLELLGCYLIWLGQKQSNALLWIGGIAVLAGFGFALAQASENLPGRAYAAYGGIYIMAAFLWLIFVDKHVPDKWDVAGVAISMLGAAVILFGPRG